MKKFISLFLVFSILLLSGNLFAQGRKGADLIVQKTDGIQVRGELIAVKKNSLLLLERDSGADVTVDIGDISVITIVKKGKAGEGALVGALLGGLAGVGVAAGGHEDAGVLPPGIYVLLSLTAGAGLGLLIGGLFGWLSGIDKTIIFEGKSDSEIQKILEYLRKKARIRNSQ